VIWLHTPPWGRWSLAILIAATAVWIEVRPPASVEHPFAVGDIQSGEIVDVGNTRMRPVPIGLLARVDLGQVAATPIRDGDPILETDLEAEGSTIPSGWYRIEMVVPGDARPGDRARIIALDSGVVADGVVTGIPEPDLLGSNLGTVAIDPASATEIAAAVAEGRAAILIATP
jgi:hypothetical protein